MCFPPPALPTLTLSRGGAGSLCSSTLEKLKGFSCLPEASVRHSDADRDEAQPNDTSREISDQRTGARPSCEETDQLGGKGRLRQPEEEEEEEKGEEEEVKAKESSVLAASKQVCKC